MTPKMAIMATTPAIHSLVTTISSIVFSVIDYWPLIRPRSLRSIKYATTQPTARIASIKTMLSTKMLQNIDDYS